MKLTLFILLVIYQRVSAVTDLSGNETTINQSPTPPKSEEATSQSPTPPKLNEATATTPLNISDCQQDECNNKNKSTNSSKKSFSFIWKLSNHADMLKRALIVIGFLTVLMLTYFTAKYYCSSKETVNNPFLKTRNSSKSKAEYRRLTKNADPLERAPLDHWGTWDDSSEDDALTNEDQLWNAGSTDGRRPAGRSGWSADNPV